MFTLHGFDEDAHAECNGYGNDETDDLWNMPPTYTEEEIADMAAVLDLNDEQAEAVHAAFVADLAHRLTMPAKPNEAELQLAAHLDEASL